MNSNNNALRAIVIVTDLADESDVQRLDGDALGVDGIEIGVLKEHDEVLLSSLLEGHEGVGLEADVRLEVLSNLADEARKREARDEQVGRPLVPANLTERVGAGLGPVGLLHMLLGVPGGTGGKGLARHLFGTGHFCSYTK
jgi:hypothetical protein